MPRAVSLQPRLKRAFATHTIMLEAAIEVAKAAIIYLHKHECLSRAISIFRVRSLRS